MMAEAIDNLLPAQTEVVYNTPTGDTRSTEGPAQKGGSFLDKISDYVPGEMREKAEQSAKDKMGGIFDGNKK